MSCRSAIIVRPLCQPIHRPAIYQRCVPYALWKKTARRRNAADFILFFLQAVSSCSFYKTVTRKYFCRVIGCFPHIIFLFIKTLLLIVNSARNMRRTGLTLKGMEGERGVIKLYCDDFSSGIMMIWLLNINARPF